MNRNHQRRQYGGNDIKIETIPSRGMRPNYGRNQYNPQYPGGIPDNSSTDPYGYYASNKNGPVQASARPPLSTDRKPMTVEPNQETNSYGEDAKSAPQSGDQPAAQPETETSMNRIGFFGVLISILTIVVGIGCIIAGIAFNFDKKGKEIYTVKDENTELTLATLMSSTYSFTKDVKYKTEYWGWFQRSHDDDFPIDDCDAYNFVLIAGLASGIVAVALGVYETFKYIKRKHGQKLIVSFPVKNRHSFYALLDWQ